MSNEFKFIHGSVVMAGMPKTGKSTFLGALYHVLETGSESSVVLDVLPIAREHLEGLRKRWLRVEGEGRTPSASPIINDLRLRIDGGKKFLALRWPDLSGEYFDVMVRKRTLNGEVAEILDDATAIIIFVHPDTVNQQPRISEVDRLASVLEPVSFEQAQTQTGSDTLESEQKDWDPMMVPGQVLVVDLIQLLLISRSIQPINKVSIVMSAWDLVCATFDSPKAYMEKQLPLLNQFLDANCDRVEFRVFGVSALGGDLEKDKVRLQEEIDPARRIRAVNEDGTKAEGGILAPIRWLIE